jgi:hypothetical protein
MVDQPSFRKEIQHEIRRGLLCSIVTIKLFIFTSVFRSYFRQPERKEIKLYEFLPIKSLLNKYKKSSSLCYFFKEPQTTVKVFLTLQHFTVFSIC